MKTTLLTGITVFAILISACRTRMDDSGKVIVELTDDSADYIEVNVEITKVSAHFSGDTANPAGWMDLSTVSGVYDLLKLANDAIAHRKREQVGAVQYIRRGPKPEAVMGGCFDFITELR